MIAVALVFSVAIASGAAVAIVYRRQKSVDAQTAKAVDDAAEVAALRRDLTSLVLAHSALRDEFDRVKLLVPRPK